MSPGPTSSHSHSHSHSQRRWRHLACLFLAMMLVVAALVMDVVDLSTVKGLVLRDGDNGARGDGGYRPLVGRDGEVYLGLKVAGDHSSSHYGGNDDPPRPMVYVEETKEWVVAPPPPTPGVDPRKREDGPGAAGTEVIVGAKSGGREQFVRNRAPASSKGGDGGGRAHPRVTCFFSMDDDPSLACNGLDGASSNELTVESIPRRADTGGRGGGKKGSSSSDYSNVRSTETDECKLSDPSYQAEGAAPPTCNDVHALGFRFGPTRREPIAGAPNGAYPSVHSIKYLTSGGFRSVWTVTQLLGDEGDADEEEREEERRVIMKTNQLRRGWSTYYLDQNRRDILVSERAGAPPGVGNVLRVHQYCAFSSVVPFASAGVLDDYVYRRRKRGDLMGADEIYDLATQAAKGLYEAHLYRDGSATHAHADVKPPQFLLFPRKENDNNVTTPTMQINDFNRGKFLTRSARTNETCPFRMCHVHHKGSLYRSPEEYMDCADQSDAIDVYSLGGVFFFLLSDGRKPWYYMERYDRAVKAILNGETPRLPEVEEYGREFGGEIAALVRERSRHPAFARLREVMIRCWSLEPGDRPLSSWVVQMLEEGRREIDASSQKGKGLPKLTKKFTGGKS